MAEGFDIRSLSYELNTKIANLVVINLVPEEKTTNSTTYARAGGGILDLDLFRYTKIKAMDFIAASGQVGGGGMDVQLYDRESAVEAGVVSFGGGDDDSIDFSDVISYFSGKSGKILLEVNFRKAGAVGPSDIAGATLNIYGVLKL